MERFWVPLCILTVAGFTFNTSELIPIGLLSDIAGSFGVSEARAGMLITVYAWVVALMSLPLMLLFARMEYRRLMLGVVGVFVVSHIATVLSTGYYSLMVSRIGVALAHSLFWSIAPAMAVAVAPKSRRATALSALVASPCFSPTPRCGRRRGGSCSGSASGACARYSGGMENDVCRPRSACLPRAYGAVAKVSYY